MFAVVGTMRTYLQQFQLKKSAKQKMKTGESFDWKDAKTTFVKAQEEARAAAPKTIVEMTLEKSKKKDDDRTVKAKTGSIKQKLKRGKKLSADELEYLRQHDEKLYKKAKVTMEEREKLARALKSAKTKAEAMRAVAIAYANAAAACSDAIDSASGGGVSGGAVSAGDAGASAEGAASFDTGVSMDGRQPQTRAWREPRRMCPLARKRRLCRKARRRMPRTRQMRKRTQQTRQARTARKMRKVLWGRVLTKMKRLKTLRPLSTGSTKMTAANSTSL